MEIQHIFDSGANEIRIFEMVKSFIESRKQVNKLPIHNVIDSATMKMVHYDLALKANDVMSKNEKMKVEDFRELPEVKKLWGAMDVIKEYYL